MDAECDQVWVEELGEDKWEDAVDGMPVHASPLFVVYPSSPPPTQSEGKPFVFSSLPTPPAPSRLLPVRTH
jgi:hypothetical protein